MKTLKSQKSKLKKNVFLGMVLLLASCSTPKNVTYFPDLSSQTQISNNSINKITVQPEDKLSIVVTTQDPALNNLFNLVTTQNRVGTMSNYNNGQVPYYTVDRNGDINFPVIGKIHIEGLTRDQVAEKIEGELVSKDMVKDPVVTVEYANTGVSVLGEVSKPGRYEFNRDRLTILDAISLAGDLTINGMRDNVLVMRRNGQGGQDIYRISLLDSKELTSSPAYYLQQDDIIYVEPNAKRKRDTTAAGNTTYTPSFWVSIGSLGITVATLITTLTK